MHDAIPMYLVDFGPLLKRKSFSPVKWEKMAGWEHQQIEIESPNFGKLVVTNRASRFDMKNDRCILMPGAKIHSNPFSSYNH